MRGEVGGGEGEASAEVVEADGDAALVAEHARARELPRVRERHLP